MRIQSFRRINSSDFDQKDRALVDKLSSAINVYLDDVFNAFTNNLSIDDNFNQKKKTLSVTVNSSGVPLNTTQLNTGLGAACYGIQVVNAQNTTSSSTTPTSYPFISFTQNGGLITITSITGLQANNTYTLSLIIIP